jgi:hypothetical protein
VFSDAEKLARHAGFDPPSNRAPHLGSAGDSEVDPGCSGASPDRFSLGSRSGEALVRAKPLQQVAESKYQS